MPLDKSGRVFSADHTNWSTLEWVLDTDGYTTRDLTLQLFQTVPDQLPVCEGREPALQGVWCEGCPQGCLPALVQCLPIPHAEHRPAGEGMACGSSFFN